MDRESGTLINKQANRDGNNELTALVMRNAATSVTRATAPTATAKIPAAEKLVPELPEPPAALPERLSPVFDHELELLLLASSSPFSEPDVPSPSDSEPEPPPEPELE